MTTSATANSRSGQHASRATDRPTDWRRFAGHYLVMVVAMYVGMLVLDPVYAAVATHVGYADPWAELPVVSALVMTINMTTSPCSQPCCWSCSAATATTPPDPASTYRDRKDRSYDHSRPPATSIGDQRNRGSEPPPGRC